MTKTYALMIDAETQARTAVGAPGHNDTTSGGALAFAARTAVAVSGMCVLLLAAAGSVGLL